MLTSGKSLDLHVCLYYNSVFRSLYKVFNIIFPTEITVYNKHGN